MNKWIKGMSTNISRVFYIFEPLLNAFFVVKVRILFVFKNITMCMSHKIKAMPVDLTGSCQLRRTPVKESPRAF